MRGGHAAAAAGDAGQHYLRPQVGGVTIQPKPCVAPSPALDSLVLGGGGDRAAVQPLEDISTLAPLSCDACMPFYLSRATLHHGRPPAPPTTTTFAFPSS